MRVGCGATTGSLASAATKPQPLRLPCPRSRVIRSVGHAREGDCPILRDWRARLCSGAAHRAPSLGPAQLSHCGAKMGQFRRLMKPLRCREEAHAPRCKPPGPCKSVLPCRVRYTRIEPQALSGVGSAVGTLRWPRHWLGSGPCPCSSQPCTEEPRRSEWPRPRQRARARRIGRRLSGRLGLHQLSRARAGTAPGRHTAPSTGGQGLREREVAASPS